jgi:hypothetical protein
MSCRAASLIRIGSRWSRKHAARRDVETDAPVRALEQQHPAVARHLARTELHRGVAARVPRKQSDLLRPYRGCGSDKTLRLLESGVLS